MPALGVEGLADYGKLPKAKKGGARKPGADGVIGYPIKDFYLTNPIARASSVMAELSAMAKARAAAPIAAE